MLTWALDNILYGVFSVGSLDASRLAEYLMEEVNIEEVLPLNSKLTV